MRPLHRAFPSSKLLRSIPAVFSALLLAGLLAGRAADEEKKTSISALEKPAPENVADLKAIQQQVKAVLKKVIPATVGLRSGGASGSGVIIDKEGHVLTAGHVSAVADRNVTIILPDGKTVKGKTLGANHGIDSGLIKITDKGDFPFVEMGKSSELKKGQWCIATGHPGGFRPGRSPVVRLGRILDANPSAIRTDCTLVGGDSGGPLFDMAGRVIGIHSRIGGSITANLHVPVDTYRDTWDRLVKAEVWGRGFGFPNLANVPYLGIEGDPEGKDARITKIIKGSAAEKAGLKVDDVITSFDGKKIERYDDLRPHILKKKIGDKVAVEILRDKKTVKLELVLGKRPD
ncbi:MAG: trypsin-like peptidase domain-containing protein [Planctomycetes bacterium]|nr:trypsin-like peptidase domain-containing protein [Planctomycetota bacterium]